MLRQPSLGRRGTIRWSPATILRLAAVALAACVSAPGQPLDPGAAPQAAAPPPTQLVTLGDLTQSSLDLSPQVERLTVEVPAGFSPFEDLAGEVWWTADGSGAPGPRGPGTFSVAPAGPIAFDAARGVFTDGRVDEGGLAQALQAGGFRTAEVARRDFLWIPILLVEGELADGGRSAGAFVYSGRDRSTIYLSYLPEAAPATPRDRERWGAFRRSLTTGCRPPLSALEARADLEFLYRTLQSAHYDLFAHRPKADYDRLYAATRAAIRGPVSYRELLRLFVPFVAYGRIGHGHLDFPIAEYFQAANSGEKVLPFDLRVRGGRALVLRNFSGDPRLAPGTEVLALDGVPVARVLARAARYISGERPAYLHAKMELELSRWLWLDGGSRGRFAVEVARPDRARARFEVPGAPITAVENARQARIRHWQQQVVEILPGGVAYLRPGSLHDDSSPLSRSYGEGFRRFVDGAFGRFLAAGATRLLLDLRNNPGGETSLGDMIVSWFATRPFRLTGRQMLKASPEARELLRPPPGFPPADVNALWRRSIREMERHADGERFNFPPLLNSPRPEPRFHGPVYVLVNRHSISLATTIAALLQDYGFGKVLGQETADLPTGYSSVDEFWLPRSRLEVSYPKAYFVRPNGDERLRGVVPDVALDSPLEDDSGDLVLGAALDVIRREPLPRAER